MLGLRHYNGLAIDLWQGHFSRFSCDVLATPVFVSRKQELTKVAKIICSDLQQWEAATKKENSVEGQASLLLAAEHHELFGALSPISFDFFLTTLSKDEDFFTLSIKCFLPSDNRHLSVVIPAVDILEKAMAMMKKLKSLIDSLDQTSPKKRITFILDSAEQHDLFQNALFEMFPDKD